jgi:hypothetical protein
MSNINRCLLIGTIGIITTAILHIILTLLISAKVTTLVFFIVYPIFIGFLLAGFIKVLKEQKSA